MAGIVKNDFSKGDVWRIIMRMAMPMMMAELVYVLYSVVDRMYIGHMAEVGDLALTGLGVTTPIVSVTAAFASLFGTGGGPLCSIARGKGNTEEAETIMGNTFTLILVVGSLLTVGLLIFMKPLLLLFGASDATMPYAEGYGRIYVCGTVFSMLSLGMNYFINLQGFARTGMLTVALGAAINIVLDPIFIFGFDMGIVGAAAATLIAQLCSALWVMLFLSGKRSILKIRLKKMRLRAMTVGRIMALGASGFFMKATTGLVQIIYNRQLSIYGGDVFIGSMTVVNSVRDVLFMTFHGLTNACQPVIGFNYGAKKYDRVRDGIRFTTIICAAYATLSWIIVMLLPEPLARVFTDDGEILAICVPALRIFFCGFMFKSLQMVGQCVFVALGYSKRAIFFSLLRKVIIVLPLLYILPRLWGLGPYGVFCSDPVADLIGSSICYTTMYLTVYKKLGSLTDGGYIN